MEQKFELIPFRRRGHMTFGMAVTLLEYVLGSRNVLEVLSNGRLKFGSGMDAGEVGYEGRDMAVLLLRQELYEGDLVAVGFLETGACFYLDADLFARDDIVQEILEREYNPDSYGVRTANVWIELHALLSRLSEIVSRHGQTIVCAVTGALSPHLLAMIKTSVDLHIQESERKVVKNVAEHLKQQSALFGPEMSKTASEHGASLIRFPEHGKGGNLPSKK